MLELSDIKKLRDARIYFGHQSVGANILDGTIALTQRSTSNLGSLRITAIDDSLEINGPAIYHSRIGKNRDIPSKLAAFENTLIGHGVGERVEVALMKLCYVDITAATDVNEVLKLYSAAIESIQKRLPNLRIVHCTVPLTVHGGGLRRMLRNWIRGDQVNAARSKFNQLLRDRYSDRNLIFDIAAVESTRPDGRRQSFRRDGETCFAAVPQYTDGAGHLNKIGAELVADEFLHSLIRALNAAN